MSKIEYNARNFASAIVHSNDLNTNVGTMKTQAEGILNAITSPEGLDVSTEVAQIRTQIDSFSTRVQEIVNDLASIRTQIEAMDANAAAQIENFINLPKPVYENSEIMGFDDLPSQERTKLWVKEKGRKVADTARVGMIAVEDGAVNYVLVPVGKGINWAAVGVANKLGFIDDETAYKTIEENNNALNSLRENPYTKTYTDAYGRERYVSYMVDDSWIAPDGKVYDGIKVTAGTVLNITLLATPLGVPVSVMQAGGNAGDRALSQGYEVNDYTINYVLTSELLEIPKAMVEKNVLGKIPQAKGVKGKTQNILIGGASQAAEMPLDVALQYATYNNTKWGTSLDGNQVVVPKTFTEVWEENGGWKAMGTDAAIGMAFTAGGEAISETLHYATNKNLTKQFDSVFEEINQKYGKGVSWYKDDIMKDLDETLNVYGKTIDDKKNAVKYMEEYMKKDDGSDYFKYQDMKIKVLKYDTVNSGKYVAEPFYNFPKIHESIGKFNDYNNKINTYTSKYNANHVDLNNNTLIMSGDAFSQMQYIKDSGAAAFNLPVGNGKSINVLKSSSPDQDYIHEGIHDSANRVNGSSGFKYWESDRGINEGATEFIASEVSGVKGTSEYEPIVKVYGAMSDALDARGMNGVDTISKDYYNGDEMSLEFNFQTAVGEPHNTFNSDTYTKFKEASYVISRQDLYDSSTIQKANNTLSYITNKILDATADYKLHKLQGGN